MVKRILRLNPALYDKVYLWHFKNNHLPKPFVKHLRQLDKNSTVIDLGANVGLITEILAQTGAKVIAFEPNIHVLKKLNKVAARYSNVEVIEVAAGTRNRKTYMHHHKNPELWENVWTQSSSLLTVSPELSRKNRDKIDEIDFAQFLSNFNSKIDLIKIDIEGYEIKLINHLIDKSALYNIEMLYVETHERFNPEMREDVENLKKRIRKNNLGKKFFLNWE